MRVLVVSMFPEDQYAMRALKAGASGYLNKGSDAAQIVLAGGCRHEEGGDYMGGLWVLEVPDRARAVALRLATGSPPIRAAPSSVIRPVGLVPPRGSRSGRSVDTTNSTARHSRPMIAAITAIASLPVVWDGTGRACSGSGQPSTSKLISA